MCPRAASSTWLSFPFPAGFYAPRPKIPRDCRLDDRRAARHGVAAGNAREESHCMQPLTALLAMAAAFLTGPAQAAPPGPPLTQDGRHALGPAAYPHHHPLGLIDR